MLCPTLGAIMITILTWIFILPIRLIMGIICTRITGLIVLLMLQTMWVQRSINGHGVPCGLIWKTMVGTI